MLRGWDRQSLRKKNSMAKRKRAAAKNKSTSKSTKPKPKRNKAKANKTAKKSAETNKSAAKSKKKSSKKVKPEIVTERDVVPRATDVDKTDFKVQPASPTYTRMSVNVIFLQYFCAQVISWNVDGLRGKLRVQGLAKIVNEELPDLLVIQEVKMQVITDALVFVICLHIVLGYNKDNWNVARVLSFVILDYLATVVHIRLVPRPHYHPPSDM